MNEEKYEKKLSYSFDFLFGFIVSPFLYFFVTTSVSLIKNGINIADGNAILYVAMLTGLIYLLKKDLYLIFDNKVKNWIFMFIGFLSFWIAFTLLNLR